MNAKDYWQREQRYIEAIQLLADVIKESRRHPRYNHRNRRRKRPQPISRLPFTMIERLISWAITRLEKAVTRTVRKALYHIPKRRR